MPTARSIPISRVRSKTAGASVVTLPIRLPPRTLDDPAGAAVMAGGVAVVATNEEPRSRIQDLLFVRSLAAVALVAGRALAGDGFGMILRAVVGEVADGHEAVQPARALRPDVVLMHIRMPGLGGIEATRRLLGPRACAPGSRCRPRSTGTSTSTTP